jgi:TPR repeat protein
VKKHTVIALCVLLALSLVAVISFVVWQTEAERVDEITARAEAGEVAAQLRLGQLYWQGNDNAGLEPNNELAEQWLQAAAVQGHQPAQHALGVFYQNIGDHVGAYAWLSIAASATNGNTAQLRDVSAGRMNAAELAEARKLIKEVRGRMK